MDTSATIQKAATFHAQGRLSEAQDLCRSVLLLEPRNVQALLLLGVIEAKVGDPLVSISLLEQVESLDPSSFQAPFWLSVSLRKLGRFTEATQAAVRASGLKEDAQGLTQLALCLIDERILPEAEAALRSASELAPEVIPIRCQLSRCLSLQGRTEEAQGVLTDILKLAGTQQPNLEKTAQLLLSLEHWTGAEAVATRLLELHPASESGHLILAKSAIEQGQQGRTIEILEGLLQSHPDHPEALALLGVALQSTGQIDDANAHFRRSLENNSRQGYAYFALVHNSPRTTEWTEEVEAMQRLLNNDLELAWQQASYLHYALGKVFENGQEYERSFQHYQQANEIERTRKLKSRPLDRAEYASRTDRIIGTFTPTFLADNAGHGTNSNLPIFVVGMMRSGTTLVEQILSSHPQVDAGGEHPLWPDNWRQTMTSDHCNMRWQELAGLSERYVHLLSQAHQNSTRVVDKMPDNKSGLGIIHLALPNAKIIHVRRHPFDTCWSIYTTPNRAFVEYGHDLANIGFAHHEHLRLMDHWKAVLPADTFLDLSYEAIVYDHEITVRQLLEFCGLEWFEGCLTHHQNARSVLTPSAWQVRQPIYRSSVERWQKFEPWLGELLKELQSDCPRSKENQTAPQALK